MHVTRLNTLLPLLFMLIMLVPIALLRTSANPRWLADSPWPMFMHDPQHTGRSKYLGAQTNSSKWRFRTGGWVYSSPAIGSDGTIYVGSFDGCLYAIGGNVSEGGFPIFQQTLIILGATAILVILIIIVILKRERKPL